MAGLPAQHQVDQSLKAAADQAKARLAELEQAVTGLQAELRALDQEHQQSIKTREDRLAEDRRTIENERRIAIETHDREQTERRRVQAEERGGIEAERDRALGEAGVDTQALINWSRTLRPPRGRSRGSISSATR